MKLEEYKKLKFDDLVAMYEDDPIKYQISMEGVIEDFIENYTSDSNKLKLRQLQWRIMAQLRGYKDPIARYNKMVELFWQGVREFKQTLNGV